MNIPGKSFALPARFAVILQNHIFCYVLLAAVTVLAFSNILQNRFVLDDQDLIAD